MWYRVVQLTRFLNDSIAGICYLLPFGLIWVLVVIEVAINSRTVTLIKLISLDKDNVNKQELLNCYVRCTPKPILRLYDESQDSVSSLSRLHLLLEEIRAQLWNRLQTLIFFNCHSQIAHFLQFLPLHHSQALFSPSEAASPTQAEGSRGCGEGWWGCPPLHILQGQRSGTHVESGTWRNRTLWDIWEILRYLFLIWKQKLCRAKSSATVCVGLIFLIWKQKPEQPFLHIWMWE